MIKTPLTDEEQKRLVAPWIGLTKALCEGDNPDREICERCFIYHRNLLTKKIQDPTPKPGFMIIFEGKTRTGKNVHMKPVGTLLGSEQFLITSKLSDIVGEHATLW